MKEERKVRKSRSVGNLSIGNSDIDIDLGDLEEMLGSDDFDLADLEDAVAQTGPPLKPKTAPIMTHHQSKITT